MLLSLVLSARLAACPSWSAWLAAAVACDDCKSAAAAAAAAAFFFSSRAAATVPGFGLPWEEFPLETPLCCEVLPEMLKKNKK